MESKVKHDTGNIYSPKELKVATENIISKEGHESNLKYMNDDIEMEISSKAHSKVSPRPYSHISSEMRKSIIDSLERGICTRKSAALTFNLPYGAVSTIYNNFLKTGYVDKKKRTVFKPKILGEEHVKFLLNSLADNCTYTLKELAKLLEDKYQIQVSTTTINRNIMNFHYTLKRERKMLLPTLTKEMICERKAYGKLYLQLKNSGRLLIYFDETGFKISIRKFAKIKSVNASLKTRNKTIMASLTNDELLYYRCFEGSGTRDVLTEYLKELFAFLHRRKIKNAIILMDNAVLYHDEHVREVTQQAGHDLVFITPYSPFFNPVEIMFSQWNSLIRSKNPSNDLELEALITFFSGVIGPEECSVYCQRVSDNVMSCLSDTLIFTV